MLTILLSKEISLNHPHLKKEVQDFTRIYIKERGFYDLVVTNQDLKVIASKKIEWVDKNYSHELMKKTIQSGEMNNEIEKSGGLLSNFYNKLILYSPLWIHGKMPFEIQSDVNSVAAFVPTKNAFLFL